MFQIAIDTDTMPVSPAVYADEYRGRALPTVLPLVQGFRGNLRVYFLGEHAPSENAAVALYLRALQSKEKLVQTGLGTRGISDAGNVYYDVPLAADTTALSAVLGNRENVIMRAGIVANDVTASPQTNFEWQLNIAVSASAVGTGEKPPVSPNAIEEHNNDVAAHPFILQKIAAAEVDVSGLRTSIAGVSESLNATNTNLNNAKSELSSEISSVSASLLEEIIARENADAELRAALTEEQGARSEADSELRVAITEEISVEVNARIAADSELSEAIKSEANRRFSENSILRNLITGETTARKAGDVNLCNFILSEKSARQSENSVLRAEISAETTARSEADSELRAAIAAETTARSVADSELHAAISEEATARSVRDSELCALIGAETTARENLILSERVARSNADAHLNSELQTEISERKALITKTEIGPLSFTRILNPKGNSILCGSGGFNCITWLNGGGRIGVEVNSSSTMLKAVGQNAICATKNKLSMYKPGSGDAAFNADNCKTYMAFNGNKAICANENTTNVIGGGALALSASATGTNLYAGGENFISASGSETYIYGRGNLAIFIDSGSETERILSANGCGIVIYSKGTAILSANGCGWSLCKGDGFPVIKSKGENGVEIYDSYGDLAFSALQENTKIYTGGNPVLSGCQGTTLFRAELNGASEFRPYPLLSAPKCSGKTTLYGVNGNPLLTSDNGATRLEGGRIDICGACVYVNGVKIST